MSSPLPYKYLEFFHPKALTLVQSRQPKSVPKPHRLQIKIRVRVEPQRHPNSKKKKLEGYKRPRVEPGAHGFEKDKWLLSIDKSPLVARANGHVEALVAEIFRWPPRYVRIARGTRLREKIVELGHWPSSTVDLTGKEPLTLKLGQAIINDAIEDTETTPPKAYEKEQRFGKRVGKRMNEFWRSVADQQVKVKDVKGMSEEGDRTGKLSDLLEPTGASDEEKEKKGQ